MLELGKYYKVEPVKLKNVAKRQDISDKYLEQVVSILNKAGLVRSIRGAKGGYVLSYAPDKYKASDILKTVEGNIAVVDEYDVGSEVDNEESYVCNRLWKDLNISINNVLDKVTLADMLEWEKEKDVGSIESLWI